MRTAGIGSLDDPSTRPAPAPRSTYSLRAFRGHACNPISTLVIVRGPSTTGNQASTEKPAARYGTRSLLRASRSGKLSRTPPPKTPNPAAPPKRGFAENDRSTHSTPTPPAGKFTPIAYARCGTADV